jgi:hypothetical protein
VQVGPGFGASPLLFATAFAALELDGVRLQVLMVRDKRKEHHQKRWVEGDRAAAQGARAVLIDDFMGGGSAWPLVRQALAEDEVALDIAAVAVFFDMWMPLGSRQITMAGCPVHALFTRHDIGFSRDCFDAVPPLMKGTQPELVGPRPLWWRFGLNEKAGYPLKCAPVVADEAVDPEAALSDAHRAHEIARLKAQLREAINRRRAPLHSDYVLNDDARKHKARLAQAVLARGEAAAQVEMDLGMLRAWADARALTLQEAARHIAEATAAAAQLLPDTEKLKDRLLARIDAVRTLRDIHALDAALQREQDLSRTVSSEGETT